MPSDEDFINGAADDEAKDPVKIEATTDKKRPTNVTPYEFLDC